MPTYEYACEACENTWEAEQRITEPALTECPRCKEPKARRLISGSRFVLKGGGWYADGYGSKKSSESKPETKSESKPADSKPAESKPAETKSESKSDTGSTSS
jgi:putative FmdB family regulatory protein